MPLALEPRLADGRKHLAQLVTGDTGLPRSKPRCKSTAQRLSAHEKAWMQSMRALQAEPQSLAPDTRSVLILLTKVLAALRHTVASVSTASRPRERSVHLEKEQCLQRVARHGTEAF